MASSAWQEGRAGWEGGWGARAAIQAAGALQAAGLCPPTSCEPVQTTSVLKSAHMAPSRPAARNSLLPSPVLVAPTPTCRKRLAPSCLSTSTGGWQQLQREQEIWQKPSGASSALASNLEEGRVVGAGGAGKPRRSW